MVIHWYHCVEFLSFILAVVFFADLKKFKLGGYLLYLLLVCITELTASNIEAFGLTNNHFVYDIFIVIGSMIITYIYYHILDYKGLAKKIYLSMSVGAISFMLFDLFYLQGFVVYDTYNNTVNTCIAIIVTSLLLVKLFMDDSTELKLTDNPYFWICAGTILFNLSDMLILGLQQFILQKQIKLGGIMLYNVILPIFCGILYGSLSYSFILCRKLTTRLSLS